MWRHLSGFFVVLIIAASSSGLAQEPTAKAGVFATLKEEYLEAQKKFMEERREAAAALKAAKEDLKNALADAKTDEEKDAARKKFAVKPTAPSDSPAKLFSPRFLAFANDNPKDPEAMDALTMALQTSGGASSKIGTWEPTIKLLQAHYVTKPEVKKVLRQLARSNDADASKLLRDVIDKNSDRKVQAFACKQLAESHRNAAKMAEQYETNSELRRAVEEQRGKDYVDKLVANADKAKSKAEELDKLLRDRYADVFPDLSVGKRAPEVLIQDIEGVPAKLSALKGKVVVLDIWATWCGPCRAMIPHEREMVERLKDKPFTLVSISADEELKTLTDFLGKEKMPWTHWWAGTKGGILEDWDVQYFPTIYILDANGVIRFKDLRGKEMEEAVEKLLAEEKTKS